MPCSFASLPVWLAGTLAVGTVGASPSRGESGGEPPEDAVPADAIALRWSVPAACPSGETFVAAIESLVGHALAVADDAPIRVDGRVTADGGGFHLHLTVTSGAVVHTRDLSDAECSTLVDAGSVVVATRILDEEPPPAIDTPLEPSVPANVESPASESPASEPPASEPSASTGVDPEPRAIEARPVDRAALDPAAPDLRAALAVLGGIGWGSQPAVAGILRGEASLLGRRWRVGAMVEHGFGTAALDSRGIGVSVRATGAGVRGCFVPTIGPIELGPCGGVDLAWVRGAGQGPVDRTATPRELWVGLPLGGTVGWAPVRWLALRAVVDVPIALRRPGFHIAVGDRPQLLFRSAPVAIRALAGLELRLP